jgi:hypothetical protein
MEDAFYIGQEEIPLQKSGHMRSKNNDTEKVIIIKCSRKEICGITQNKIVQVVKKTHSLSFWFHLLVGLFVSNVVTK